MDMIQTHLRHQSFDNEGSAKAVAAKLRARSKKYASLRAYVCKVGGAKHWHVGRGRRR